MEESLPSLRADVVGFKLVVLKIMYGNPLKEKIRVHVQVPSFSAVGAAGGAS